MITVSEYCIRTFGEKLYKLSLNGGFTCPNRDGMLDVRGCIFCSKGGSGDFAGSPDRSIEEQLEEAKQRIAGKFRGSHYIAYFQAFTNTYAPVEKLRSLFLPLIRREEVAVLSIATRPDCLGPEVLSLLEELSRIKPVWVELGLQTVNAESVSYIRRGYANEVYQAAVKALNAIGVHTVTHVILGLPGEGTEDMLRTVRYVIACGSQGIKLQLLHVLEGTDLAEDYRRGEFETLTMEAYFDLLRRILPMLPQEMVVHRLTGDGPKKLLIAPLWSANKKRVLGGIQKIINEFQETGQ